MGNPDLEDNVMDIFGEAGSEREWHELYIVVSGMNYT